MLAHDLPSTASNAEALPFVSPVTDTMLTLEQVISIFGKSAFTDQHSDTFDCLCLEPTVTLRVANCSLCVLSLLHAKPYAVHICYAAAHSCSPLLFSEDEAKLGARRLARCLQKLGFKVRMITKLSVSNIITDTRFAGIVFLIIFVEVLHFICLANVLACMEI